MYEYIQLAKYNPRPPGGAPSGDPSCALPYGNPNHLTLTPNHLTSSLTCRFNKGIYLYLNVFKSKHRQ